jgi:uncharacterized cupredoxin-like copper-binding protein
MLARRHVVAAAATVLLTAASMTVLATTGDPPERYRGPGMMRGFAAYSPGCDLPSVSGARVDVVVSDMRGAGMMAGFGMHRGRMMLHPSTGTVAAGRVTFVAVNHGTRAHELVVLPLAEGAAAGARPVGGDGTVDESGSLGEASRDCGAGGGDGIRPGSAGWVTLTLAPGRYELVCNIPGHYAAGMYAELDVT